LESVESELELAVFRLEPGLEEGLEPLPLVGDEAVSALLIEPDRWRLVVAEHIDVADRLRLARFDGRQDLIGGAGRIRLAVRHRGEVLRQFRPKAMAQDGDDHIASGRLGDLLLKSGVRLVVLAFPADGFEARDARELAV